MKNFIRRWTKRLTCLVKGHVMEVDPNFHLAWKGHKCKAKTCKRCDHFDYDIPLSGLVTETLKSRSGALKDAIHTSHPILDAMRKRGGIKKMDGGKTIT